MKQGYQLNYVSDNYRHEAPIVNGSEIKISNTGLPHKILVIPETMFMPEATFENILKLAHDGGTVVFQKLPTDVPEFFKLEQRRTQLQNAVGSLSLKDAGDKIQKAVVGKGQILVSTDLQKGLQLVKMQGETITETGLKFIRKIRDDGKSYYLVNHTDHNIDEWLTLTTPATIATIPDPQNGRYGLAEIQTVEQGIKVHVQVEAGDAIFKTSITNAPTNKWVYT